MDKKDIGSSLSDFLKDESRLEAAQRIAIKRILAWQLSKIMEDQKLTKVEMARRMKTSRTQVDRLLDPDNNKVQLDTLERAASILGKELRVELV
jgi:predicted XRE-type DNA-binding protein